MHFSAIFRFSGFLLMAALAFSLTPVAAPSAFAASEIKIVVNNQAITSVDIARRVAFLKLQRAGGNLGEKAREQLIEEALKRQEAARARALASDAEVNASFERFAASNNLSSKQLTDVLNQAGVTPKHFKNYIQIQMSWPRLVQAATGGRGGGMSTQDLVSKMLERGSDKPSTTEYILQQVIFVVPANKRSNATLNARKREADQLRGRYQGCDSAASVIGDLRDVSLRQLGRIMQPQLPPEWKPLIEKTETGSATQTRITDRGVEFIVICSAKTVSDDKAAEMVFRSENEGDGESEEAKKFLAEIRKRAVIANK
ncbi:MAG: peptidylprolyl isomerase [Hoeflea sp.]|uniref:peptidylprolyl isomerase n=1 Tax=Hoeflea sp. TaxID=1940281 RepID=UPI001D2A02EF|nr:peptidylprolyl isomerase [Hoeflea sp.]MBU4530111.1 peptidylprolyl isomerase [Alphaproteobacteria bacterium]MBU4542604.1 peptidylprolyl isomerase [Alphaproteobacteria bacterium]MBU4551285.1 peptidylprolyl isomerase [Alphaproteobacteria bacterium]MBV1723108.1 peptidylprolyl isomerase [Hoeflea sp.]MBV1760119.1 peptidylprolyl isomerase [Hoeflea sp.]